MPCKGYLDVEGEKGALSSVEGKRLLDKTLQHWFDLIAERWPTCFQESPNARDFIVLDGSRPTKNVLKVSYRVILPGLTFARNDGVLQDVVKELSSKPNLQNPTASGAMRPFVDGGVYTRNQRGQCPLSSNQIKNTVCITSKGICPPRSVSPGLCHSN